MEELTKISVICSKEIASKLMELLHNTKSYLHWYENEPTDIDLAEYEDLKGSVSVRF